MAEKNQSMGYFRLGAGHNFCPPESPPGRPTWAPQSHTLTAFKSRQFAAELFLGQGLFYLDSLAGADLDRLLQRRVALQLQLNLVAPRIQREFHWGRLRNDLGPHRDLGAFGFGFYADAPHVLRRASEDFFEAADGLDLLGLTHFGERRGNRHRLAGGLQIRAGRRIDITSLLEHYAVRAPGCCNLCRRLFAGVFSIENDAGARWLALH